MMSNDCEFSHPHDLLGQSKGTRRITPKFIILVFYVCHSLPDLKHDCLASSYTAALDML